LAEALILKQKSKSDLVREAIADYMDGTDNGIDRQNQQNKKIKKH
jgi:hypothetical protein